MKHIWSLMCKESKIDANTNNISIIDAFESLQFDVNADDPKYVEGSPIGLQFNFEFVSVYFRDKSGDEETHEQTLIVLDPKGNKLGEFNSQIIFQSEHNRTRNILRFNTIALSTSGTYLFQINTNNKGSEKRRLESAIPISIKVKVNGKDL